MQKTTPKANGAIEVAKKFIFRDLDRKEIDPSKIVIILLMRMTAVEWISNFNTTIWVNDYSYHISVILNTTS